MSSLTTVPRVEIANRCEQQGLEADCEVRNILEQRFRCEEHIHWLEQQVHAELQWRSFQQRFEKMCGNANLLKAKAALITCSNRLLPAPSQ